MPLPLDYGGAYVSPLTNVLLCRHNFLRDITSLTNIYLHTVGVVTVPICRGCNEEEETAEHIFRECPALASYRKSILGDIWPSMANTREYPSSALLKYIQAVE